MFRTAVIAALIALPGIAAAQDQQAQTGQPPQRVRSVTIQGNEPCPKSTATEIVVCDKLQEPYRIPKGLRDQKPVAAQNQSWVNRSATMDDISRRAGGLPDTCSPVGSGGQSGCALQQNNAFAAEKRARRNGDADLDQ